MDELLCDNIHHSEQIYCNELADLVKDCSVDELHIISELARSSRRPVLTVQRKVRKRRTKAEMAAAKAAEEAAMQMEI